MQAITYQTMKIARDFAAREVEVSLLSAQYPEDRDVVPEGFTATPDLARSVLDVDSFAGRRKLPLIADLIERLHRNSDADWLVFTNNDIALMPHFYLTVKRLIESGRDALVINRRVVSDEYRSIEQIPLMYPLIGTPHEGHDCFVFPRHVYGKLQLAEASVGAPWVGRILLWNLVCHSQRFEELRDHHLTFHLGITDWESDAHTEYASHNERELRKVLEHLRAAGVPLHKDGPLARYLADIWFLLPLPEYRPKAWKKPGKWLMRRGRAVWAALNGRGQASESASEKAPSVWTAGRGEDV